MAQDNDEEIIELTEIAGAEDAGSDDPDIIELTDIAAKASEDEDDAGVNVPESMTNMSQEMLEAALERVIEKKFSETIEKILFEVSERVIQKEIADIKASLQSDLDKIGNA